MHVTARLHGVARSMEIEKIVGCRYRNKHVILVLPKLTSVNRRQNAFVVSECGEILRGFATQRNCCTHYRFGRISAYLTEGKGRVNSLEFTTPEIAIVTAAITANIYDRCSTATYRRYKRRITHDLSDKSAL